LFSAGSYALITDIGIDPLDQTSGAKPLSLGGAFAGASNDVNCLFYNPAALANSRGIILSLKDDKNFSLGAIYETRIGNFGIGAVYRNREIGLNDTLKAKYESNLSLFSYGTSYEQFSFGFAIKNVLSQTLTVPGLSDRSMDIGTDYDAGILCKPVNYASFGMMLRNISGAEYKFGSSQEAFPRATRFGLVLDILGKTSIYYNEVLGLKAAYDVESGDAGDDQKHNSFYGVEGSLNNRLFVRFGGSSIYKIDNNVTGSSIGLGIKFGDAELDLASINDPITEAQASYISISYSPQALIFYQAPEKVSPVEIKPEIPKELLTVNFPNDNFITYDENIAISGETRPGASILINGTETDVGKDGRFKAIQPLLSGKNLISIYARSGYETKTIYRKVLKKAKVILAEEINIDKKIAQEVISKEAEISKKEAEIVKDKEKGIDVSQKEKIVKEDKIKQEEKKVQLTEQKKQLEDTKDKLENLVTLGVIEISPEAKFQIEVPITRGEMITWLVKASGLALPEVEGPVFTDVPQNHRYASSIKAALDAGLVKGEADGRFRPDDSVKKEEEQEFYKAFGIIK